MRLLAINGGIKKMDIIEIRFLLKKNENSIQQKKKDFTRQAKMIGAQKVLYTVARKIINQMIVKQ